MKNFKLTEPVLSRLYHILVETCEAGPDERGQFLLLAEKQDPSRTFEWRFRGSLGFGGKIWIYNSVIPYVTCYREDETPERKAAILSANKQIRLLFQELAEEACNE